MVDDNEARERLRRVCMTHTEASMVLGDASRYRVMWHDILGTERDERLWRSARARWNVAATLDDKVDAVAARIEVVDE